VAGSAPAAPLASSSSEELARSVAPPPAPPPRSPVASELAAAQPTAAPEPQRDRAGAPPRHEARPAGATTPHALDAPLAAPAQTSTVESLQLADELRLRGDDAAAVALLEATLRRHPRDPAAGMIEHSLGRLYLDRLGDPARAASMFAAVVARGTPQPLVEAALARRAEALWKAGDREAARAVRVEYEQRYPSGSWSAALGTLMGPP
jgi:transmembrane sensor